MFMRDGCEDAVEEAVARLGEALICATCRTNAAEISAKCRVGPGEICNGRVVMAEAVEAMRIDH